jgi:hypothetical protein
MSGLPACITPWIGATLSEHAELTLDEKTFSPGSHGVATIKEAVNLTGLR